MSAELGLHFSDIYRLNKHHQKDNVIRNSNLKTKDLVVPISEQLRSVLSRYKDHSVFQLINQYLNK